MGFGSTSFDGQHGGSKRRLGKKNIRSMGGGIISVKYLIFIVLAAKRMGHMK
jgi:hypothetical protein